MKNSTQNYVLAVVVHNFLLIFFILVWFATKSLSTNNYITVVYQV